MPDGISVRNAFTMLVLRDPSLRSLHGLTPPRRSVAITSTRAERANTGARQNRFLLTQREESMWKWIGGILLIIILCLAGAMWAGYQKLTSGGDAATVTIAGSPERVFAALANHDSLASWYVLKGDPTPTGHGLFGAGDSLPAQTPRSGSRGSKWVADEVVPGKLLVLSLHNDTNHAVIAVRRDTLISLGDSTRIISTVSSPMMDSVRSQSDNGALVGASSKLLISGMRLQSKIELARLKNHIEGRPVEDARP